MEVFQQELDDAISLLNRGEIDQAKSNFEIILKKNAQHSQANFYLGTILNQQKDVLSSLPHLKIALEAAPEVSHYWIAYIQGLIAADKINDASLVLSYAIDAGLAQDWVNKLNNIISLRKENESHIQQENALRNIELNLMQLFSSKQYEVIEQKVSYFLEQYPNWLNGWKILSDTYLIQGKDARKPAKKALALNQQDAQEHCYYGLILTNQGDLMGAAQAFSDAIVLNPSYAAAHNNLGIVKKDMGDIEAGIASYRQALKINPNYASCFSNLLFCLTHYEKYDAKKLFQAHLKYGRQYEPIYKAYQQAHVNVKDVQRCLNIGFVSADFRDHSVAYCFEPILNALALSNEINLFAYYNHTIFDETTQRLRLKFKHWHDVADCSDESLCAQIRQDAIDILIDLSGHTAGNRLTVFAKKPAPIQATWFGYMATTGLKAMDYYLADRFLLPTKQFDHLFTEKIVQLPANAPFALDEHAPVVNVLPALKNGFITFGCFNRPSKISHQTVALWSSLLNAIPTSQLVLGAVTPGNDQTLINWFTAHGVAKNRLKFYGHCDMHTYLMRHHQVDICLDTMPSSGVTTTFHAAWMGVPTLCIAGDKITSRGAMAIMSHLQLTQYVALNSDEFVQNGKVLIKDLNVLADIRQHLRHQFKASVLSQPQIIANALQKAFKTMWQAWCINKTSTSFMVDGDI